MRRIVKTSRGWIDLDLTADGWYGATVYGEDGLETDGAVWSERVGERAGQPTFATFVAATVGIPADEAETIAERVLAEWPERQSGAEHARERRLAARGRESSPAS